MEKVIVGKKVSFEKGLFSALEQLGLGDTVDVCYSTKAYTQVLLSNWNRKAGPEEPRYKARTHEVLGTSGKLEPVLTVQRVK